MTKTEIICCNCEKPAQKCHNYLLPNARNNPKSNGYERDSLVWSSDYTNHSCGESLCVQFALCTDAEGYEEGTTFSRVPQFEHMFFNGE